MMNKGCVLALSGKASEEMSNPYIRMYEQITRTKFVEGAAPIIQRFGKEPRPPEQCLDDRPPINLRTIKVLGLAISLIATADEVIE